MAFVEIKNLGRGASFRGLTETFSLYIKFEVPVRHANRDAKETIGFMTVAQKRSLGKDIIGSHGYTKALGKWHILQGERAQAREGCGLCALLNKWGWGRVMLNRARE